MSSKPTIIDVRTQEEWRHGHVEGSILLPIDTLAIGKLPDLPKDARIYLYCRSGNRSELAKQILSSKGFTNVTNLKTLQAASQYGRIIKGN